MVEYNNHKLVVTRQTDWEEDKQMKHVAKQVFPGGSLHN